MYEQSNPNNVDTSKPFIYMVEIKSGDKSFNYIGKASSKARLKEYKINIEKILTGRARRPEIKRNGEPQSQSNLRYRFVHLALALAVKHNWEIKHYPVENSTKEALEQREQDLISELQCNLNNRERWEIKDFERLAGQFLKEFRLLT